MNLVNGNRIDPGKRQWRFRMAEETVNVPISGRLNTNSLSFLRSMAVDAQGIIMVPKWSVDDDLKLGRLVPVLADFSLNLTGIPIHAVFAHKRHLAPKVRAFVDFLAERLKAL